MASKSTDSGQPLQRVSADHLSCNFRTRILPDKEFERIRGMIYDLCRINLGLGKKELVQARLSKRLRRLGIDSFGEYLKFVEDDQSGAELSAMVDVLTTNLTYFFREPDHFVFLKDEILSKIVWSKEKRFRMWSAGCSSGEEAYSLAIVLLEALNGIRHGDAIILASDISSKVLNTAREGLFSAQRLKDTPDHVKQRHFQKVHTGAGDTMYLASPELKKHIFFRRMNLADNWPMKGPFDVILCRNVMIYFDRKTQEELVSRFYRILNPGGYFFVGHSESLTSIKHRFSFVRPSIYRKEMSD